MTSKEKLIKEQNDFCNISKWHEAGITGKGMVCWNMETPNSDHAKITTQRIKDAAPDATIFTLSHSFAYDDANVLYSYVTIDGEKIDAEQFIADNKIKFLTKSVAGKKATGACVKYWQDLQNKYNLIMFNAAGNEGSNGVSAALPTECAMLIAGCNLVKGIPRRDNSSSIGDDVDFIDFRGDQSGTSFAGPYLCGKAMLIGQKFGVNLTQKEVFQYFKEHVLDVEATGEDDKSGWGLTIMGDPKTTIRVQVGSSIMTVDGKETILDQPPVVDKNTQRTLVPIRAIAEAFGATVNWDAKTQTIEIIK